MLQQIPEEMKTMLNILKSIKNAIKGIESLEQYQIFKPQYL